MQPVEQLPNSILSLSGQTADRLLALGDGDAALVYLSLLRRGEASGLKLEPARLQAAMDKLEEEFHELKTAVAENTNVEEELGDLLFAAVKIARFFQIDAETALAGTCEKFIRRFSGVEAAVTAQGKQMTDLDVSELMTYWNREKHPEKD